jgi:glutamyl-tRNA synthetase
MTSIRTRFAPSPTGYIHVGNVRAALFPWLLARQQKGTFVLRIEDTDQARLVEGAQDLILDTLEWLGINWDEGPRKGGNFGPYIQTERREHYLKWAQKLIDKGLAYADPYTPEEVTAFRDQAKAEKRAFLYRDHRPENPPAWDGSQALRFKVPEIKRYTWNDPVMGELSAGPEALDDFILVKSDGLPTYNFAHIVDDYEMGITHVIRGLEYISSIPKYLSLYDALEIEWPVLACLPHIMAPDGKKKLGKRDGAKSVQEYKDQGILPEAMLNFLASMGWNDGTEQEIFTRDELIEKFSLERVQRSGARFDEQRLLWLNGQHIRMLSLDDLYERVADFWPESAANAGEEKKKQILALVQDRLKTLLDLPLLTEYFFAEPTPDWTMVDDNKQLKKFDRSELAMLLEATKQALSTSDFDANSVQETLNGLLDTTGQKPGILFSLIRLAVSWAPFSPALNDTLATLGKEVTLHRLDAAITAGK